MQIKLIGAAIDKCAGILGAADTPRELQALLKDVNLEIKDTIYYNDGRHDLNKLETYFTSLANLVSSTLTSKNFPLIIGGDHSCAIGSWSGVSAYLMKKNQSLGLIWIDAHMDSHTPQTTMSGNIHGMPLATLMGYGYEELIHILNKNPKLDPTNLILIGIRSYENAEYDLLNKLGVKIYYSHEVDERGFATIFSEAWQYLDTHTSKIGLSIDVDGFDPEFTPGVGTAEPNGINFNQFIEEYVKLDASKLIALEIAEANHRLDSSGKTLDCVARIVKATQKLV